MDIQVVLEELGQQIRTFFTSATASIADAENFFLEKIKSAITGLLTAYYEELDANLLADKKRRKEEGLLVQRKNDNREVLTQLGVISYQRTYYRCKPTADGTTCYCYPIDAVAGVSKRERISLNTVTELVDAACDMSYEKASNVVAGGAISRQTVMNKIRKSEALTPLVELRSVPVLHVDADEDHIKLQNGKSKIVPLVSVYEGFEKNGKRSLCKNVFHMAEFEQDADTIWENVLTEIDRRYNLENTRIYLHGDGAAWIKTGLEWLPNSVFVLDRFHKNKALKQIFTNIPARTAGQYEARLRKALKSSDRDSFCKLIDKLLAAYPDCAKTITKHSNYILNHFEGITICYSDPEATNGGATEPHVSHVLSRRLSSRPMAWSKETLKSFVPILAAGKCVVPQPDNDPLPVVVKTVDDYQRRHKKVKFTLGLPNPDSVATMPGKHGQVTPLSRALGRL